MNENQEGLFKDEMNEGKPMQLVPHHCSKCDTGYATAECHKQAKIDEMAKQLQVAVNGANSAYAVSPDYAASIPVDELEKLLTGKPGGIVKVDPRKVHHVGPALTNSETVIQALLGSIIGEDVTREGLLETPKRVVKAWKHWTSGYHVDIAGLLKTFEDGAEGCDEMVVRKNIRIYSHCEHHLAPIIGDCTIAYIPNGRVVGLSKLDRLADAFARRLQVQERLTNQIADALMTHLQPRGVAVHINARHMCIESRGVAQHDSGTITSALRGVMKDQPETRAEFMALVNAK